MNPPASSRTFLWRVALNLCYDELRRINRRRESAFDRDGEPERHEGSRVDDASPDICLEERERAEIVRKALSRLEEPYQTVVILRHYEGLKFREIAEVLEIPEGTVKSRMVEALSQLNRFLTYTLKRGEASCTQPKRSKESLSL